MKSKVLLIFQLNQNLMFLHNRNSKYINQTLKAQNLKFNDSYENYDILFRRGRVEMLDSLFNTYRDKLQIAVWSHLQGPLTEALAQRFFARYYRSLLFVMATNRQLYVNSGNRTESQQPLKIRKDLKNVYLKFPAFQPGNTLVISPFPNLLEQYSKNDLLIPSFTPQNPKFYKDGGLEALNKYIKGILLLRQEKKVEDIRFLSSSKQIGVMFDRYAHNIFTDRKYI